MTPLGLLLMVLYVLLAIAVVVLLYYVVNWVLGLLGVQVPPQILKVIFVILGLIAVIAAITGGIQGWSISMQHTSELTKEILNVA